MNLSIIRILPRLTLHLLVSLYVGFKTPLKNADFYVKILPNASLVAIYVVVTKLTLWQDTVWLMLCI